MQLSIENCETELHKMWQDTVYHSSSTDYDVFRFIGGQQYPLEIRANVGFVLSGILGSHLKSNYYPKFKPDLNLTYEVLRHELNYVKSIAHQVTEVEKVNLQYCLYSIEHLLATRLDSQDNGRLLELGGWSRRYIDAHLAAESIAKKVLGEEAENPAGWTLLAAAFLDQGQLGDYENAWTKARNFGGNPDYLENLRLKFIRLTSETPGEELPFVETPSPSRKTLSRSVNSSRINSESNRLSLLQELVELARSLNPNEKTDVAKITLLSKRLRDWHFESSDIVPPVVPTLLSEIFQQYQDQYGHMGLIRTQSDFEVFQEEFWNFQKAGLSPNHYLPLFEVVLRK
jgi:hypothetical protein